MLLVTSVGEPSRGEHVGVFTVTVGLIGGEKSPVKAAVAVVSAGGRG